MPPRIGPGGSVEELLCFDVGFPALVACWALEGEASRRAITAIAMLIWRMACSVGNRGERDRTADILLKPANEVKNCFKTSSYACSRTGLPRRNICCRP